MYLCRHLEDPEVKDAIMRIWTSEYQGKGFFSNLCKMQRFYRHYCEKKLEKWKDIEKILMDELCKATMEVQQDHLSENAQRRLEESKASLNIFEQLEMEGAQVRAMVR